jgi:transposase
MAKHVFVSSTAIEIRDALNGVLLNSSRFNWKLYEAFVEACLVYLNVLFKQDNTSKDLAELEKVIRKKIGNKFNTKFRDARFQMSLLAIQIWLRLQVLGRYINTCLIHGQNGITIS